MLSRRQLLTGVACASILVGETKPPGAEARTLDHRGRGPIGHQFKFAPSASWTGVGGSGLNAAGVAYDVADPALPSPVVRLVSMHRCAITGDFDVLFSVHQAAHLGGYTIAAAVEGPLVTLAQTPATHSYTNPSNGQSYTSFPCYKITIDYAAAMAMVTTGELIGVVVVTPSHAGMSPRTLTFRYFPRNGLDRQAATAGGQTAGSEYDRIIEVYNTTGTDIAGVRYYDNAAGGQGALEKALGYLNSNSAANTLAGVRFMSNGGYYWVNGATGTAVKREAWTRLFMATGVSALLGDGVHFQQFGSTNYDGMLFENFSIDLRRVRLTGSGQFRLPSGTNNLLGFSGGELYFGSNTFGDPNASGSGMTSLYNGQTPSTGWISLQDGTYADLGLFEASLHDLAGPAVLTAKGTVRNCTIQDVAGTLFKDSPAHVHGGAFKRNGGYWSGLRSYWPMIQLTAPATGQFMIQGTSGNPRTLSLVQGSPTAWTPNSGVVSTTSANMPIPASGGVGSGKVLFIANPGASDLFVAVGDNTVVATQSSTLIAGSSTNNSYGGGFVTLTGTETNIAIITRTGTMSGVTVIRSCFDLAQTSGVTPMTSIVSGINAYTATDASWSAASIPPAHSTDPVLDAMYMGANLNGFAHPTIPTPINTAPPYGSPGVIYCWVDQHGDAIFFDTGTYQNWCYEYVTFSEIRAANVILLNGGTNKDCCLINHVCVSDDLQVYGQSFSGGVLGGSGSHFFVRNSSWAGGLCTINGFTPDAFCGVDGSALYTMSGTPTNTNMVWSNCSFGKGFSALPQGGVNVTNSVLNNTQDDTVRFTFIPTTTANESTPPNMTPYSATALQLPDLTICGRYNLDGSERIAA